MKFYARLDGADLVIGTKQVKAEIEKDDHIEINSLDATDIGEKYNRETGQFEKVPVEPSVVDEIDVVSLSDAEFKKLILKKLGYKVKK